jgi:hypothetical protein
MSIWIHSPDVITTLPGSQRFGDTSISTNNGTQAFIAATRRCCGGPRWTLLPLYNTSKITRNRSPSRSILIINFPLLVRKIAHEQRVAAPPWSRFTFVDHPTIHGDCVRIQEVPPCDTPDILHAVDLAAADRDSCRWEAPDSLRTVETGDH